MVQLEPGSTLLLYTDGLVERRGGVIDQQLSALQSVVAHHQGDLGSLCDSVLLALEAEASDDDVAILALHLQE